MGWQQEFRRNNCFECPTARRDGKEEPKLFKFLPEVKSELSDYGMKKSNDISTEHVHREFVENILPRAHKKYVEEMKLVDGVSYDLNEMLTFLRYTSQHYIGKSTIYNWMKYLGFKYNEGKKLFILISMKVKKTLSTESNLLRGILSRK